MKFKIKMRWLNFGQEWVALEGEDILIDRIQDGKMIYKKFKGLNKEKDKEYLITITSIK